MTTQQQLKAERDDWERRYQQLFLVVTTFMRALVRGVNIDRACDDLLAGVCEVEGLSDEEKAQILDAEPPQRAH